MQMLKVKKKEMNKMSKVDSMKARQMFGPNPFDLVNVEEARTREEVKGGDKDYQAFFQKSLKVAIRKSSMIILMLIGKQTMNPTN